MADCIQYKRGDIVRILDDEGKVKNLQDGHGDYNFQMKHYLGKVGQVVNMDSEGDLHIRFGGTWFVYNPRCCVPAPGEIVYERSGGESDSETFTLDQEGLNNFLMMKMLSGISSESDSIKLLFSATCKGDINMVRALLNKNPELVNKIHNITTPLILASHEGHRSIVLELLDKGADIDKFDEKGNTPLIIAIAKKRSDIGKLLIEKGANVNIINNNGRTALHYAAYNDDSNLMEIIIGKGCDVNLQDSNGDTALHCAVYIGSNKAVAVLCGNYNFNPGIVNRKGFNILQLASLKNQEIAVDKILDRHKSLVNAKTLDGLTALHVAAFNNHTGCAKLLIEKGNADINNKNLDDRTPLMLAAFEGNFECVQLLIEKNADVNAVDRIKYTPLHACCIRRGSQELFAAMMGLSLGSGNKGDRLKVAKYLIEKGARTDLKNVNGNTFLECCSDANMKRSLSEFIRERQSGGSTGSDNSGSTNSGSTNSGLPGSTNSGSTGSTNSGSTGSTNSGSFNSGSTGPTNKGSTNSGSTGSTNSGSTNSGSTGPTNKGSTNSGSTGSTNSGSTNSGSTGPTNKGSTNSGSTGSTNSGSTGPTNSGSTNSGSTGSTNSGSTGSTNSGSTGSTNSRSTGSTNSGSTNSGSTGSTNSGAAGLPCIRCISKPAIITLLPCGHKCLCPDCARQTPICPVCQQYIFQRVITNFGEGDVNCCVQ